jgi:hypothetical protein
MGENLRTALPILMLVVGIAMIAYAAFRQYVALPEEHTRKQVGLRVTLGCGGIALLLLGSRFLP